MKHDSRYGTTCWFCGHVGNRTKRVEEVTYQACDDCRLAKGTREELRERRNLDVAGLRAVMEGKEYTPVYWTPARMEQIAGDNWGLPEALLQRFRWQEYADSTLERTKERRTAGAKAYAREYYAKLRTQKKAGTQKSIEELINRRDK